MAFLKRTWLARIGTGLNKFIIGNKDGEGKQTLTNAPDSVTQIGDVISAENLNDLEDRIEAGFNEKQDVLTFDNVPTQDSDNPVKSGGVYTAVNNLASEVGGMKLTKVWENSSPSSSYSSGDITLNDVINDVIIEFRPRYTLNTTEFAHIRSYESYSPVGTLHTTLSFLYYGEVQGDSSSSATILYRLIEVLAGTDSTVIHIGNCRKLGTTTGNLDYHGIPVAIYKVGNGLYSN